MADETVVFNYDVSSTNWNSLENRVQAVKDFVDTWLSLPEPVKEEIREQQAVFDIRELGQKIQLMD